MGNGEQYIWKPPEDDEMLVHQNKALAPLGAHTVDSIQPSAAVVSNTTPPSVHQFLTAFGSLFHNIPLGGEAQWVPPGCDPVDRAATKPPEPQS